MKLYHGTSEWAAREALSKGLHPRGGDSIDNWEHTVSSNLYNKNLLTCFAPWFLATLFFGLHLFLYWLFSEIRKRKEIPGVGNEA